MHRHPVELWALKNLRSWSLERWARWRRVGAPWTEVWQNVLESADSQEAKVQLEMLRCPHPQKCIHGDLTSPSSDTYKNFPRNALTEAWPVHLGILTRISSFVCQERLPSNFQMLILLLLSGIKLISSILSSISTDGEIMCLCCLVFPSYLFFVSFCFVVPLSLWQVCIRFLSPTTGLWPDCFDKGHLEDPQRTEEDGQHPVCRTWEA